MSKTEVAIIALQSQVDKFCVDYAPKGCVQQRYGFGDAYLDLNMHWTRPGWAQNVSLSHRFSPEAKTIEEKSIITVTWPSTERDVIAALAAVVLLEEVVRFAAQLQVFLHTLIKQNNV